MLGVEILKKKKKKRFLIIQKLLVKSVVQSRVFDRILRSVRKIELIKATIKMSPSREVSNT